MLAEQAVPVQLNNDRVRAEPVLGSDHCERVAPLDRPTQDPRRQHRFGLREDPDFGQSHRNCCWRRPDVPCDPSSASAPTPTTARAVMATAGV
jgi:hypothetical protein